MDISQNRMTDDEIVSLYNQRNEAALKETASKYGGYCFAVANNILSNTQDAEECLNDAYLAVWNSIPPQQPKSLKLFLVKIVRNLSLNKYNAEHAQKRGGYNTALSLHECEEFLSGVSDIDSELEAERFKSCINNFLHSLPKREANIFVRRYFFFDTTAQIADRYDLKESHVLVILSRTRQKLRRYLTEEGYII